MITSKVAKNIAGYTGENLKGLIEIPAKTFAYLPLDSIINCHHAEMHTRTELIEKIITKKDAWIPRGPFCPKTCYSVIEAIKISKLVKPSISKAVKSFL